MKPKTKLLFVALGLLLPYMAFMQYNAFTHPESSVSAMATIYAAPCYLFGSMLVFLLARKKIVANIYLHQPHLKKPHKGLDKRSCAPLPRIHLAVRASRLHT